MARAIATHVDKFINILHESICWGSFVVLSGPDDTGEARMHM